MLSPDTSSKRHIRITHILIIQQQSDRWPGKQCGQQLFLDRDSAAPWIAILCVFLARRQVPTRAYLQADREIAINKI